MFKKFFAVLMIISFTNAYAMSPVQRSNEVAKQLNKTFDSLNYKLNVEWNQKDSRFFDATISDFEKEIASLQKDGVTRADLLKFTTGKIKDKQIQKEIVEMSKVIAASQMSNEEARSFIVSKLGSTYSHGASWSGDRAGVATALIVGAVVLILLSVHAYCEEHDGRCHTLD